MANYLEVPFERDGIMKNATIQLDRNGAYVTMGDGPSVYIDGRIVEEFVDKWNEVKSER